MINQSAAIDVGYRTRHIEKDLEDELVRRACGGDGEAFGQLYELLGDRIYRYVYFRVTDEEMAEDLTSKVFLKAWEHLPDFKKGSSPFIAWLYTIAHNTLIDHYRTDRQAAHLDEITSLPASDPLPDEQTDVRLQNDSLRRALQKLTPTQRDVITMKLIDGMPTDEIAQRMNKSEGAVRALQMRALHALAGIMKKQGVTGL
jgi:RNA polymerase sigma-70 factor (ECF subfamily)